MLLQMEQRRRCCFNCSMAWARARASSLLERSTWKARRCADLVPMPGSLRSSSIRRDMGSAKRVVMFSWVLAGESGDVQSAHQALHAGLHGLIGASAALVDGRCDEVFEQFNVSRVAAENSRIDLEL